MKKHRNDPVAEITDERIDSYADELSSSEPDHIQELIRSSDEELEFIDMLSGRQVGQLLRTFIRSLNARRVLEIGTFTGYSALMMADLMPEDAELITIEMNLRYQALAEKHFKDYDEKEIIQLIRGNAREVIPELQGPFDLIYLDADKVSYPFYFQESIRLLRTNGLLVADNTLWDGTVLQPEDHKASRIHEFNKMVSEDKRVEQVLLPVRDGVTVITKLV